MWLQNDVREVLQGNSFRRRKLCENTSWTRSLNTNSNNVYIGIVARFPVMNLIIINNAWKALNSEGQHSVKYVLEYDEQFAGE